MNKTGKNLLLTVFIAIALSLVVVLLGSCGENQPSSSDNVVSEVVMATAVDANDRPLNSTTVFSDNASGFYCSFKLAGFPVGSTIKADLVYVGGEMETQVGKNYLVDSQTGTIERKGEGYTLVVFPIPPVPDYTWPHGEYKIVISVDGQTKASAYFKVE